MEYDTHMRISAMKETHLLVWMFRKKKENLVNMIVLLQQKDPLYSSIHVSLENYIYNRFRIYPGDFEATLYKFLRQPVLPSNSNITESAPQSRATVSQNPKGKSHTL